MITIEEMIAQSEEYDSHKTDWVVNLKEVQFDEETAEIRVPNTLFGALPPLDMTDWALSQMCQKLGSLPYSYAKICPPSLRAYNLNFWAKQAQDDKHITLRGYDQKCRAVLSGLYSPISNTQVLTKAADVMNDVKYYESHYLDADTFHGKFTVGNKDANPNNSFGVGFYIGNGEIGNRSVRIAPYLQRTQCQNSIVMLDWGIEIRHYRVTPAFIYGAIKETIGQAIGKSVAAIEEFVKAEAMAIPNISEVINNLADRYGLSLPVRDDMLFGTEGQATLAGVINGLSYAAQKIEGIEQRIDMEALAGAILIQPANLQRRVLAVPEVEYEPAG